MKTQGWQIAMAIGLGISGAIELSILPANAQSVIVPDETLGAERSQVEFRNTGERITGGAVRGINLFHSFLEFNVQAGRTTYFLAPNVGIENILARVTGRNPSEIFGTLGTAQLVNGRLRAANANLFLINPNGILFGQNASLDVDKSFVATTANAIQFGNQGNFSASTLNVPSSLLTINPSAFLFNQIAASIENRSRANAGRDPSDSFNVFGLRVPDSRSLLMLGGNIDTNGGGIVAFGGRIDIGGLAGAGVVELNINGDNLQLNFLDNSPRADIFHKNGAGFIVEAGGGGNIALTGRNIEISGRSSINAGILDGLNTASGRAGDVTINATGKVSLVGQGSYISNNVSSNIAVDGGNINIFAKTLSVRDGAYVISNNFGIGQGGNITIRALDPGLFHSS